MTLPTENLQLIYNYCGIYAYKFYYVSHYHRSAIIDYLHSLNLTIDKLLKLLQTNIITNYMDMDYFIKKYNIFTINTLVEISKINYVDYNDSFMKAYKSFMKEYKSLSNDPSAINILIYVFDHIDLFKQIYCNYYEKRKSSILNEIMMMVIKHKSMKIYWWLLITVSEVINYPTEFKIDRDILKLAYINNKLNHLHIARYAINQSSINILSLVADKIPTFHKSLCTNAAKNKQWDIVKYIHLNGGRWDSEVTYYAAIYDNCEMLNWLRERNCPINFNMICAQIKNTKMLEWILTNNLW